MQNDYFCVTFLIQQKLEKKLVNVKNSIWPDHSGFHKCFDAFIGTSAKLTDTVEV